MRWRKLLNWVFPIYCLGCHQELTMLCEECAQKMTPLPFQVCPICLMSSDQGRVHDFCQKGSALQGLLVAGSYHVNPILAEAIKRFKYEYSVELLDRLGLFLSHSIAQEMADLADIILIPVPCDARRQRNRGYNQAELLAEYVGHYLNLPCKSWLKKTRHTPQQARLPREERLTNVVDAFALDTGRAPDSLPFDKTIVLIDDVAATLTTLNECAKVLRAHGARRVLSAVLGRG